MRVGDLGMDTSLTQLEAMAKSLDMELSLKLAPSLDCDDTDVPSNFLKSAVSYDDEDIPIQRTPSASPNTDPSIIRSHISKNLSDQKSPMVPENSGVGRFLDSLREESRNKGKEVLSSVLLRNNWEADGYSTVS